MLGLEALNDVFFSLLISKSNRNQSSQESEKMSSIGSEGKNSSQASLTANKSKKPRNQTKKPVLDLKARCSPNNHPNKVNSQTNNKTQNVAQRFIH